MVEAVAVTIDTRQAGGKVYILIRQPLFRAVVVHINVGVTEIAAFGRDFPDDVKKHLVLIVKCIFAISNSRWNLLGVLRRLWHKGVVSVRHISGGAADGSETTGGGSGPAEVLMSYLYGEFGLVVGWVGIVTAHAVDFQFS